MAVDEAGEGVPVPPLLIETDEEQAICAQARVRREQRLKRRAEAI
ncbi:MAG: hypothetical protein QM736_26615 [Vicinamibacterales bacterium]